MTAQVPPGTGDVVVTLTGVRSVTHLVHATSYLSSLRRALAAAGDPAAIVVDYLGSGRFLGTDPVSDEAADRWLSIDGTLAVRRPSGPLRYAAQGAGRHVYLSVGVPGIKPWLGMVRTRPGRPPHVVVVDEGLGSYGTWRSRRAAYRRQGGREPRPTVRAAAVSLASRILTAERWALYTRPSGGAWQVDEAVASPFRAVRRPGAAARTDVAVYLTQPWVELGLVDVARYVEHLHGVADGARRAGLRLAVRPHPAEAGDRYLGLKGIELLAADGPAELDPQVLRAAAALGADSTALLNVSALHGLPGVRVGLPELAVLEASLAPDQRSLLDAYLPAPVPEAGVARALGEQAAGRRDASPPPGRESRDLSQ